MLVQVPKDVVCREIHGEAVLLNLATGIYFGLDPVGTRVWQLIGEQGSTEKIAEAMLAEYEVDDRRLRQDLDDLIRQLRDKGLVTTDGEQAPPPR